MDPKHLWMDPRHSEPRCAYCGVLFEEEGDAAKTRDHVPSRVLLDKPYPEGVDLPIVDVCFRCNNGLSDDEAYLSGLLECVVSGSADPATFERPKIAKLFRGAEDLRSRIEGSLVTSVSGPKWRIEEDRAWRVFMKLARGHLAYENLARLDAPSVRSFEPLHLMTADERHVFEHGEQSLLFPELGSRGFERVVKSSTKDSWQVVQPGRYRYAVTFNPVSTTVRFVIRDYLACLVRWD